MNEFLCTPEQGFLVRYSAVSLENVFQHRFCGSNTIEGADCPNCSLPLLLFLDLDVSDQRLKAHGDESIPLLFCWRCNVSQEPFLYRYSRPVSLLSYGRGGVETDFPYPEYPVSFPEGVATLESISDVDQRTIRGINTESIDAWDALQLHPSLARVRHQIGGEPYLVQRDRSPRMKCRTCRQWMPFLASIADDCLDPRGFTGNDTVQVLYHLCKACRVVGALQEVA